MAPKNSQNKPPIPSAPSSSTSPNSKYSIDEVFLEKKRKIGNIKMPSANISSRTTKSPALAERNGGGDLPICSGQLSTAGSDCGRIEFTKESIEALLNEGSKIKNMRLNYKERCGRMMDYIKRLKDCIKWFQPLEGSYVAELEKLKDLLEAAEKKCNNIEMKAKEDELNSIIMELRKNYDASQEKLEKTENDKLEALDSYTREKEARAAAERLQTSLSKDLNRAQTDIASGNQKIQSLNDMCKRLQEHNTSLQHYNSKLQSELATANETLKRVEKEKAVVAENLSTVWGHCTSLQEQLTSSRSKYSVDEVFFEKKKKIGNIKMPPANFSSITTNNPALAERNGGGNLPICSGPLSTAGSDCGSIEFTKESIEALLNEGWKVKNERLNYKERCGLMMDYIKRLKDCIKWFQQLEGSYVAELEKLKDLLEAAEKKCNNIEMVMKAKEEELNSIIMELRKNYEASQEKLEKTENDKLEALDSYTREKEARAAAERLQTSLSEDINRTQTDIASGNQKIQSLNDMYKRLQEHNTSLQHYNSKLQSELATANETLKRVEKEKVVVAENLSTVWGHCTSLQEQLTSSRSAQEDAVRQKEALAE